MYESMRSNEITILMAELKKKSTTMTGRSTKFQIFKIENLKLVF